MIRRIRRGRSPNCSSAGSVVGIALVSAVATATVVNAYAHRFVRWLDPPATPPDRDGIAPDDAAPPTPPAVRREAFGAIVAWPEPPALLYVDGADAEAALARGRVVGGGAAVPGALSAPTEVHVAVTDRCPASCRGCYLSAAPDAPDPDFDALVADLRRLAAMGVLEIALGGGEAALRDDVIALGEAIRGLGMVPNLTTSGLGLTPERAARMAAVFGQVNVSVDGLAGTYEAVRGWDGHGHALRAIRLLSAAGARVGVNTVLTRANLADLERLGDALAALGVAEWQWLRFKPAGRGVAVYDELRLTPEQALQLWPRALALEERTGLALRFDCALVPFLAAHGVDPAVAERLGIEGCPGGASLLARAADGAWSPCSFARAPGAPRAAATPEDAWAADPVLAAWRDRAEAPPEPCGSCDWRAVCRGGCRVVAGHLTGDPLAPDPECPRVQRAAEAA